MSRLYLVNRATLKETSNHSCETPGCHDPQPKQPLPALKGKISGTLTIRMSLQGHFWQNFKSAHCKSDFKEHENERN
jgi:hypothetical protein